jgi:hypothetical protein
MHQLFRGLDCAHGTHGVPVAGANGVKMEIKKSARTVREGATVAMWEQHIRGERPLGIVPIMSDNTCVWGAIDIDDYTIDHGALVGQLEDLSIPGVVDRTKSGGAHVYMFFEEPVAASVVLSRLRELAACLGHGDCEVFPKQDTLLLDRGDLGNWLNMPYFDSDRTNRYAYRRDGRGLSLSAFLDVAERSRITEETLVSLRFRKTLPEMSDGPPCLEQLCSTKIGQGSRNNGLFALGVLAKKMGEDDWETRLERWNHMFITPPASGEDVANIIRSLKKKEYSYKCGDQPLVSVCNMALCRTRKYGIGPGGAARILESVSILDTEPPIFFVNMRTGGTVECSPAALLNPRDFQHLVLSQLRQVIPLFKLEDWLRQVQTCVESATTIEAPREVGITGQFEELLERFCTDRHAAKDQEDIVLGKPWLDEAQGRVYFRLRDLQDMLDRHKFRELSRGQITTRIRQMMGDTEFANIRGRGVNLWWVPAERLTWARGTPALPRAEDSPL